jgi:hypothetical protein
MFAAVAAVAAFCSAPTAAAVDLCGGLGGTLEGDGLCRVHVDDPAYILEMTFPVDYPDHQTAVTDFLTSTRDDFVAQARDPEARNLPHGLDIQLTQESTETTRSVTFEVFQNSGGAHPTTWYRSFNHNLETDEPITLDTLFADGVDPVAVFRPIVERDLTEQLGEPDLVSPTAAQDPANYRNFAIAPDQVILFFDRGALMAGAAGAQKVYVPRSELPPLSV